MTGQFPSFVTIIHSIRIIDMYQVKVNLMCNSIFGQASYYSDKQSDQAKSYDVIYTVVFSNNHQ